MLNQEVGFFEVSQEVAADELQMITQLTVSAAYEHMLWRQFTDATVSWLLCVEECFWERISHRLLS